MSLKVILTVVKAIILGGGGGGVIQGSRSWPRHFLKVETFL